MSAVAVSFDQHPLSAEWLRIEVLCRYLSMNRQGEELPQDEMVRLQHLQAQVRSARHRQGAWSNLLNVELEPMAWDLLACLVAPEAEPRIGWMYQELQRNSNEPYPSPALLQELLALEPLEANALYDALNHDAPLSRWGLIRSDFPIDPYRPLRPQAGVTARLLGRRYEAAPPPGTQAVDVAAGWEQLILPPDRIRMLREYLNWILHRDRVERQWGGVCSGGPLALFAGASGTGKTFAAAVVAKALGWPLYRVDLGKLVSKYIGETEKNLNALFDAAHGRDMVLQFDEADSLFNKRGEVKEARDRYANMEVSHLLSRIEVHRGPCILTSNLRKHLDAAFARRFQMVVEFPRPDACARAKLWQRLLPARAPRRAEVDPGFLGAAVSLCGGAIKNAALHAAYLAAAEDSPIGLEHIAVAVWRELGKDGREVGRTDLGPLAPYLPELD